MRLPTFLLFVIILTSCQNQANSSRANLKDNAEIEQVWKDYYNPNLTNAKKINLLASAYKRDYLIELDQAFHMSKEELEKQDFETKINILTKRRDIQFKNLKKEQISNFKDAFVQLETTSSFLINTEAGLDEILNLNIGIAYGVYSVLSCQFVKEGNTWKINPAKEIPRVNKRHEEVKQRYIKEHGDENSAIEYVLSSTSEGAVSWEPIIEK